MGTYKLVMSYDGSRFAGFQRQSMDARPTIQGVVEDLLQTTFQETVTLHGSGRTDAGVHARAQVCHISLTANIPPDRLRYALNRQLPDDIVITEVSMAPHGFHARKCAVGKTYSYTIYNGRIPPALGHAYYTHVPQKMDAALFEEALSPLLGHHNFQGFCGRRSSIKSYDRTLLGWQLAVQDDWWHITFIGDGFLRKMVRNIVGSAIDIATGHKSRDIIKNALVSQDRCDAGHTAPAKGLVLEEVFYDQDALCKAQCALTHHMNC